MTGDHDTLPWAQIDNVLLDMDGTLLDLNYDNTLWNSLLPTRYSAANDLSEPQARQHLFDHMKELAGQLDFYCIEYWSEFTQLDITALHHELTHLIRFRPSAAEFLGNLQQRNTRTILVTNAHRTSLTVKDQHSGLLNMVDDAVSCHDYGAPKESVEFWNHLQTHHGFDRQRTLFIDDNAQVLKSAHDYGVKFLRTITQPDLARPERRDLTFPAFNGFSEIMPSCPTR